MNKRYRKCTVKAKYGKSRADNQPVCYNHRVFVSGIIYFASRITCSVVTETRVRTCNYNSCNARYILSSLLSFFFYCFSHFLVAH